MTNDVLTASPITLSPATEERLDTSTLTAKDLIGLAAELIDKNGKCEGVYEDGSDGSFCTIGAMDQIVQGFAEYHHHPLVVEAINLIDQNVVHDEAAVKHLDGTAHARVSFGWSDVNTKETVVQKLREIASS